MLNGKQQRFVAEYLVDQNATQAAIRAGYSKKTASSQGDRLLRNAEISAFLAVKLQKALDKAGLQSHEVMSSIARPLRADVRKLFNDNGDLVPIVSLGDDEAALIGGFEVLMKNVTAGDGKVDRITKVKLIDRSRYVEMGAKHFALLTEVVKHTTDDVRLARLLAGRERAAKAVKK